MFIPPSFNLQELTQKHDFIQEFGFGVIISASMTGTHLPFILAPQEGQFGVLYSHCAKANPHWKEFNTQRVLVIFTGPHGYISPSWYAKSPGVPTWNYSAVHVHGTVTMLGSSDTLKATEQLVSKYEPSLLKKRDVLTEKYQQQLLAGIVGFKIDISNIEGQRKLSQNRTKEDRQNVHRALSASGRLDDLALANYMKKFTDI